MCPTSEASGDRALLCPGTSRALEGSFVPAVFTNEIKRTPCPRFPASSRRAGVFFDDAQNFFVWQFPRMARNFHGRIRVERGIQ
jgi:hypothetical protein